MSAIASQITSLAIVYSIVYSDVDQRKHQSSASLAFAWGIHRGPVNSPHKWPVTRKMFPFDDVIMHGVSIHLDCLFKRFLRLTWKKTSKISTLLVLCRGNPLLTCSAESISIIIMSLWNKTQQHSVHPITWLNILYLNAVQFYSIYEWFHISSIYKSCILY